ncbi:hypothetical protein AIOL_004386 [Candidatus Rhodobacter oscarellae]|uniref:Uncharacterized protein n=1 Tax=Candidatus Rhodobacter oscarellae TaxID=1675527 RepID=A0A0J9ECG6_9RHOB|nr:hypothetical protein [Candidatus Rhodobacter lobularis]KMW59404.1 hypothetical protein AIOL_004386 [Candidatus Rhodobacter lobularis]
MEFASKRTKLGLLAACLAGLAACGGGGSDAGGTPPLGQTFQQAFGQGPNDAPIDVTNADLTLRLTADPFEL